MGFDLFGHKPANESGEYFRANIWSWPGILDAIEATGVLEPDRITSMSFNDGHSVSAEEATVIADRIEENIKEMDDEMVFIPQELNEMAQVFSRLVSEMVKKVPDAQVTPSQPMYSTQVSHVREFIQFARNSGGFDVC